MSASSDRNASEPAESVVTADDVLQATRQVDLHLIELLFRRCDLARQAFDSLPREEVAGLMFAHGRQIEETVAATDSTAFSGAAEGLTPDAVAAWLRHAASIGLANLHSTRISFLGPLYSYSHLAAIKYFGEAPPMAAVATIPAVFESILRGDSRAGLVPIENSTDGRIVDTLGMFVRVDVKICGEVLLPIHHNLLSRTPRESIREVHSKPQALSQCRTWLANHLPGAKLVECASTAMAADIAATTPGVAAVASIEAARQYQLDVIDASIEDNPNNVTRFAVLGRQIAAPSGQDKTAILFQVRHQPGSLADAMALFKQADLNLTWIESFPLPHSTAEYLFFVETDGHATDDRVAGALERLRAITLRLEVIGSYPKATRPPLEAAASR